MDPNETLAQIRAAAEELESRDTDVDEVTILVAGFRALDEWLSKDGFLPDAWAGPDEGWLTKCGSLPGVWRQP